MSALTLKAAADLFGVSVRTVRREIADGRLVAYRVRGEVPLTALRDLLGHSSLAVTSKYTHLARPDLVEATKKLRV
ncbi:MAG TPA: hypothetical protein PKD46_17155 [Aggregatilineaceae bacterium]|nr:hypothetical protein [Aggregatilineaceae bacterium]